MYNMFLMKASRVQDFFIVSAEDKGIMGFDIIGCGVEIGYTLLHCLHTDTELWFNCGSVVSLTSSLHALVLRCMDMCQSCTQTPAVNLPCYRQWLQTLASNYFKTWQNYNIVALLFDDSPASRLCIHLCKIIITSQLDKPLKVTANRSGLQSIRQLVKLFGYNIAARV